MRRPSPPPADRAETDRYTHRIINACGAALLLPAAQFVGPCVDGAGAVQAPTNNGFVVERGAALCAEMPDDSYELEFGLVDGHWDGRPHYTMSLARKGLAHVPMPTVPYNFVGDRCLRVDIQVLASAPSSWTPPPNLYKGGGEVPPPSSSGHPAYAPDARCQPQWALVTDSNRPQPLRRPPSTACPTASGAASEVPSLRMHPWGGGRCGGGGGGAISFFSLASKCSPRIFFGATRGTSRSSVRPPWRRSHV